MLPFMFLQLISSNPCRGLECKEPQKTFLSQRNIKKVLPWQYLSPDIAKKAIAHTFSWHETFTPILAKTRKQLPVNEQQ